MVTSVTVHLVVATLVVSSWARAEGKPSGSACRPSPVIETLLRRADGPDAVARLEAALGAHPRDVHLHRAYQDRVAQTAGGLQGLEEKYRGLAADGEDDAVLLYLWGRALALEDREEAAEVLERAAAVDPDFAWPHHGLIHVYRAVRPDPARADAHLDRFTGMCPEVLLGYQYLDHTDDPAVAARASRRLRERALRGPLRTAALPYFPKLWTTEFRVCPAAEHAGVRERLRADLERIRRLALADDREWYEVQIQGREMLGLEEGRRAVEDARVERFPADARSRDILIDRWNADHPFPGLEAPAAERADYYRSLLQASEGWLKRWPDDPWIWNHRFQAARNVPDLPLADLRRTAEALLNHLDRDLVFSSMPPVPFQIAEAYIERGMDLDRIPALVEKGFELRKRWEGLHPAPPEPGKAERERETLQHLRHESRVLLIRAHTAEGESERARALLGEMRADLDSETSVPEDDTGRLWGRARRRAEYWRLCAELASAQGESLDALLCYQSALAVDPNPDDREGRELLSAAADLWRRMGGGAEAWNDWILERRAPPAATLLWNTAEKPLPGFALEDLSGRTWRLDDLRNRTAFVAVWTTWCGPCKWELPKVQELHERFRGDDRVLVLTLNADENPGLVAPFLAGKGFGFPVLLGKAYVDRVAPGIGIPINWIVDPSGRIRREQVGFPPTDTRWVDKVAGMIEELADEDRDRN